MNGSQLLVRDSESSEQASGEEPREGPEEPEAARSPPSRLREVPDRRHDVQDADPPRGERDHDEGHENAEAEGDHEALCPEDVLDLDPCRAKRLGEKEHHAVRDSDAEQRADRRRREVVRRALEDEHLDQVSALGPDRACDAELRAALGGEHDEDQEDEEDARRDREGAEHREEGHEDVALLVGGLEAVMLRGRRGEAEGREGRLQQADNRLASRGSAPRIARARDEDLLDLARLPEQPLSGSERKQEGGGVRAAPVVGDDRRDGQRRGAAGGEDDQPVSGARVELVCCLGVEERLTGSEVAELDDPAAGLPDLAECAEARRIAREEGDPRLVLATRRVLDGNRLDDRGRDPVDEIRSARGVLDDAEHVLVEVPDAGGLPLHERRTALRGSRRHDHVRLAERFEHRRPERAPHRVARAQGRGDDGRPEHQADDDQDRASPAPGDVPNAELQEDAVPCGERPDCPDRHDERADQEDGQRVDRDSEETRHRGS